VREVKIKDSRNESREIRGRSSKKERERERERERKRERERERARARANGRRRRHTPSMPRATLPSALSWLMTIFIK
jgi:hypothetical protein